MWEPRGRLRGVGLVEVLVALTIMSVNALGWMATLQVALSLVRRIGELADGVDPAVVAGAACSLSYVVPRAVSAGANHGAAEIRRVRCSWRSRGVSLVELLVALAVGALVLGCLVATTAVTSGAARGATHTLDAAAVRAALPALLQDVVETAGRGMPTACGLTAASGSSRLDVRRALTDGSIVVVEVFAGLDGGGRPTLYLRRVPHARQPWVEDVTAFTVEHIEFAGLMPGVARAEHVVVRIAHAALEQPLDVEIALPHLPCLEAPQ